MIENNTKFEILLQKSNNIEKVRQRLFTIIILLPLAFFFLRNSIIKEVNFNIFSIKQINILLLFFPSIFSILILYISVLGNHNSKLISELNYIATNEKDPFKQYQKEKWLKLIKPINFLADILGSIKSGGILGCMGTLFVFIPIIFAVLFYTFGSFIYFLIYNFQSLKLDYYTSLGNIIFSIWVFIGMIIYEKSNIK